MLWPYIVGGAITYFTGACVMIKLRYIFGKYNYQEDTVLEFLDVVFPDERGNGLRMPAEEMKAVSFFFWIPLTVIWLMALAMRYLILFPFHLILQLVNIVTAPPDPVKKVKKKKEPKQITEKPVDPYLTEALKEVEHIAPN